MLWNTFFFQFEITPTIFGKLSVCVQVTLLFCNHYALLKTPKFVFSACQNLGKGCLIFGFILLTLKPQFLMCFSGLETPKPPNRQDSYVSQKCASWPPLPNTGGVFHFSKCPCCSKINMPPSKKENTIFWLCLHFLFSFFLCIVFLQHSRSHQKNRHPCLSKRAQIQRTILSPSVCPMAVMRAMLVMIVILG